MGLKKLVKKAASTVTSPVKKAGSEVKSGVGNVKRGLNFSNYTARIKEQIKSDNKKKKIK